MLGICRELVQRSARNRHIRRWVQFVAPQASGSNWFLTQTGAHFIQARSPWQNAFIESFNSRLRAECFDVEVFYNLADA